MDKNGIVNSSGECTMRTSAQGKLVDERPKAEVILFPILCPSGQLHAIVAARLKLVNTAVIPRIYFVMTMEKGVAPNGILSRLKGIFVLPNVRYSALSVRRGKMLVCASYFKGTSPSPKLSPLFSGQLVS